MSDYNDNLQKYCNGLNATVFVDPAWPASSLVDFIILNTSSPNGYLALDIALAASIWSEVQNHPQDITATLTKVKEALEDGRVKSLMVPWDGDSDNQDLVSWVNCFHSELAEITRDNIHVPRADELREGEEGLNRVAPTTPAFTSALLQSVAVNVGLVDSLNHVYTVMDGLGVWYDKPENTEEAEAEDVDEEQAEVCAIAALIAFAVVGGKQLAEKTAEVVTGRQYRDVVEALKALKEKGVIKYEPAKRLLEEIIEKVENWSEERLEGEEVFARLFPLESPSSVNA